MTYDSSYIRKLLDHELSDDIMELVESLSQKVHANLTEEEIETSQATVNAVMKLMVQSGYSVDLNSAKQPIKSQEAKTLLAQSQDFRKQGNLLRALDKTVQGLANSKDKILDERIYQDLLMEQVMIYQKLGFKDESLNILLNLSGIVHNKVEYHGLLGSCYKSLAFESNDLLEKEKLLHKALNAYCKIISPIKNIQITHENYWHAINICTLTFLLNEHERFNQLFSPLKLFLEKELSSSPENFWIRASYVECLLLGYFSLNSGISINQVHELYQSVVDINDQFLLQSLTRNLSEIIKAVSLTREVSFTIEEWIPLTLIVLLHSASDKETLNETISKLISTKKPGKIVFVGIYNDLNEKFVEEFSHNLVIDYDAHWLSFGRTDKTSKLTNYHHWFLHQRTVKLNPVLIQYWSQSLYGLGSYLNRTELKSELIMTEQENAHDMNGLLSNHSTNQINDQLCTFIIADVSNFSSLDDMQVRTFFTIFLDKLMSVLTPYEKHICQHEGWGDAILLIFDNAKSGVYAALDMMDKMVELKESGELISAGLPNEISMRMVIETAPLTKVYDPVERKETYTGTFLTRAARIEPITSRGEVFCGLGCAMNALAQDIKNVDFQYMGIKQLAKDYGEEQVFRVFRSN